MTDARTALKSLLIYAICVPLALMLGYLLANPLDLQGFTIMVGVVAILCAPLLIHYHYPFMLFAWNMGAVVFFLPGRMSLCVVAILLSYTVAFTHRIMDKSVRFLSVPALSRPLIALAVVVVATAELRGGFGLRSMGGETMGGRRYVEIMVGILGFFALTARQIPRERALRYIRLFFLGGAVGAISIAYGHIPGFLNFIFLFIPPSTVATEGAGIFSALRPLALSGTAVFSYLLARHGVRKLLTPGHGRLLLLAVTVAFLSLLSGSRMAFVTMSMTLAIQFWLEGLLRTKVTVVLALAGLLAAAVAVPLAPRLPPSVQRALAVLPIKVDPVVAANAQQSSEWRRQIWRVAIPQIPKYLLLGKGYAISGQDYAFMTDTSFSQDRAENRAATIAGDYHNGPLSVILPLGIWGVFAFLWVLLAGCRALWRNYRHGDPDLRNINTFLLTSFLVSIILFIFVFGNFYSSLFGFTGILGFSAALNGGIARPPAPRRYVPSARPGPMGAVAIAENK